MEIWIQPDMFLQIFQFLANSKNRKMKIAVKLACFKTLQINCIENKRIYFVKFQ